MFMKLKPTWPEIGSSNLMRKITTWLLPVMSKHKTDCFQMREWERKQDVKGKNNSLCLEYHLGDRYTFL